MTGVSTDIRVTVDTTDSTAGRVLMEPAAMGQIKLEIRRFPKQGEVESIAVRVRPRDLRLALDAVTTAMAAMAGGREP